MADNVMLMIGSFPFMIQTAGFDKLTRSTNWRWGSTELIGTSPNYQYIGQGEKTITISGGIYPHQHGFATSLDYLKKLAERGEPHLMVNMFGMSMDYWIINSINETESVYFSNGTPRKIEFEISLSYVGEYSINGTNMNLVDGVSTIASRLGDLI